MSGAENMRRGRIYWRKYSKVYHRELILFKQFKSFEEINVKGRNYDPVKAVQID